MAVWIEHRVDSVAQQLSLLVQVYQVPHNVVFELKVEIKQSHWTFEGPLFVYKPLQTLSLTTK